MKIKLPALFVFSFLLSPFLSGAQGGTWTWMHGANTISNLGNYGTKGVPAATNEPPARYEPSYWTDLQGNFWIFGGSIGTGIANDLWKYDVSTNMWTWMNGPNVVSAPNNFGVFGTKGIPSVNNFPNVRGLGADCWTDVNGDLWLYGGVNGFDDLWRYHIATNEWTWMAGTQTPATAVYGVMGVAAATNTPGCKSEVRSGWTDAANNLWMFGGTDANVSPTYNTLWKFDPSNGWWTWMNGSTMANAAGSYGSYRVEAPSNQPPSRWSYTRWIDGKGDFYIFAGNTTSANGGYLNDTWRYRPSVNAWTWVSGASVANDTGRYPPQRCHFYPNYYPPSRFENATTHGMSSCNKALWVYGGSGPDATGFAGVHADLWLFETDSFRWNWVSGSRQLNVPGVFGQMGVPAATNAPPSKNGHAMWVDKQNNVWMFGGFTQYTSTSRGVGNDLWRFVPDTTCIDPRLFGAYTIQLPDTILCAGDTGTMRIGEHAYVSYSPSAGVRPNADSSVLRFSPLFTTPYKVIIHTLDCRPNDTFRFTVQVRPRDTVRLIPPKPLALCVGDTARMSVKPGWTISVTPNSNVSYRATGGNEILFYPPADTRYTIVARNDDPCAISPDTISFTIRNDGITHHAPPVTDTILCKGDTAFYHLLAKADIWTLTPRKQFAYNPDSLRFAFYPSATTGYQLVLIQNAGCNPHDTLHFTIHRSALQAGFTLSPRETDLNEPSFQLTNTTVGGNAYKWFHNGDFVTSSLNASVTISDTGMHCFVLAAADSLGCMDTATDCGHVIDPRIYVPSAFSPNGDGKNDIFKALGRDVKIELVAVYNRFGERVFVSYSKDIGWDGTYGGRRCDVGVYFYQIKYKILNRPSVLLKGDVTLIR